MYAFLIMLTSHIAHRCQISLAKVPKHTYEMFVFVYQLTDLNLFCNIWNMYLKMKYINNKVKALVLCILVSWFGICSAYVRSPFKWLREVRLRTPSRKTLQPLLEVFNNPSSHNSHHSPTSSLPPQNV